MTYKVDILGIPLKVGDTVLCISGIGREIETIKEIGRTSILTETDKVYFFSNVLGIQDVVNNNAEYFI